MVQQVYCRSVTTAKEGGEGPIDMCRKWALSGGGREWAAAGRAELGQQVLAARCRGHW